MPAWTYILSSNSKTLYTGSTNNLHRRVLEHRCGIHSHFASKYRCHRLVWFQQFDTPQAAMARETQIKGWTRAKKIALIQSANPELRDLAQFWEYPILPPTVPTADRP
ncbi:MAG TPA: GIY-YIG nuclease family protein [Acidobacteriaceae bacterium]|jgi:putative endonuclease